MTPLPLQFALVLLASWLKRHQQEVIEYMEHYHCERNHQGLGNQLIDRRVDHVAPTGPVDCHQRPGGLLRHYERAA